MNNFLQRLLKFRRKQAQSNSPGTQMHSEMAKAIVQGILATRADEISCDECFVQLDQFAELHLDNVSAEEALPLVQDHLKRCKDCQEEFEILLLALEETL